MDLTALVEHILVDHHAPLRAAMPTIDAGLVAGGAPPRIRKPWQTLRVLLEQHLMKEENILFPAVLAHVRGDSARIAGFEGPLNQMAHEHRQIEALVEELKANQDAAGEVHDALVAMLDGLAVHKALEDGELFPAIRELTSSSAAKAPAAGSATADVAAMCKGATGYHAVFRRQVAELGKAIDGMDASPRFMAPWRHFVDGVIEHMDEEEEVLFPALTTLAQGGTPANEDWRTHLQDMEIELDQIRTIADALRVSAVELGDLEVPVLNMLDGLEEHARREEQELWPAAMGLLGGDPVEHTGAVPLDRPAAAPEGALRRTVHRISGLVGRAARAVRDSASSPR